MTRDELLEKPVIKGWLKKYADGDDETEALLDELEASLEAGANLDEIDLRALAAATLEGDERDGGAPPEPEVVLDDDAKKRAWSHGTVLGLDKTVEIVNAIVKLEGWQAQKCLEVESSLSRPRRGVIDALKARLKKLGLALDEETADQLEESLKAKKKPAAKKPAAKKPAAKKAPVPKASEDEAVEDESEDEAAEGEGETESKPATPKPAKPKKAAASTRWAAPGHAVTVRPDRELNAWLLPVEGGNAVALVRIRNVDGKKVGIYRVDDVGFPCPAKGSDLSPKQVKAIREEALKVDPIVVDANGPATEILKVKITAAGAEFPAVVVTAA